MTILKLILEAFAGSILDALVEAFKDWRSETAQRDLGAARQREADAAATTKAVDEANVIVLAPRERARTKRRMQDGTY